MIQPSACLSWQPDQGAQPCTDAAAPTPLGGTGSEIRLQPARRVNQIPNTALPCRIKINAGNFGQDVNADRLPAHAKERAPFGEVGGGQALKGPAELRQCRKNLSRVFGVRLYQNVEVFGRARLCVNGNGVGPDDK